MRIIKTLIGDLSMISALDYIGMLAFDAMLDDHNNSLSIDGNEVLDFDDHLAELVEDGLVELYEDRPDFVPTELADDIREGLEIVLVP